MSNIIQVTPFLHVTSHQRAIHFFKEVLGFKVAVEGGGYVYVEREGAGVRRLQSEEAKAYAQDRRWTANFDLRDVDGLLAELQPRLASLPPRDVVGPKDQGYGQRELMIAGPDNVVVFGQAIA